MGYLAAWKGAVYQRPAFTKVEKSMMMLSQETQVGLRMRVLSFVAIVKELLQHPELQGMYLFRRHLNSNVEKIEKATDLLQLQTSSALDEVSLEKASFSHKTA